MNAQRRGFRALARAVLIVLVCALAACTGAQTISPSSYTGSPDSATLIVHVVTSDGGSIDEATVAEQNDERVVIEVRLVEGADAEAQPVTLDAEVTLDRALGTREVVDTEGRAIPQA